MGSLLAVTGQLLLLQVHKESTKRVVYYCIGRKHPPLNYKKKKNRSNDHLRLFFKLRGGKEGKKKEKIDKKERRKGRKEEKDILPV